MSTATDLLSTAKNNGLLLSLEGENLRVRWQGVPPSQDLLASIKAHKSELISLLAINDHYENAVVNPVIQETVRQLGEVSTNGVNLKPTTDNLASEMQDIFPSSTHYPKSAVENSRLTQSEETYPQTVDGQLTPMEEVTLLTFKERYTHMVKCQLNPYWLLQGQTTVQAYTRVYD